MSPVAARARIPFFLVLTGFTGIAMLPPAIVAAQTGEFAIARAFFYASLMVLMGTVLVGLAIADRRPQNLTRAHLITLAGAYVALPAICAVPFREAVSDTTWVNATFEMVSCFTTTGATAFAPERLEMPLHLWRAEVGWLGGLFTWITAAAILAPLNLGGFEVSATSEPGRGLGGQSKLLPEYETGQRLVRYWSILMPVYVGLTIVLWICLILVGSSPVTALIRAMGTLSTSGILGVPQPGDSPQPIGSEILIFLFLFFALSRRTFASDSAVRSWRALVHDPELRLGLMVLVLGSVVLFISHFWSAIEIGNEEDSATALRSFWGIAFTVLSFLTTTGYVSTFWADAQQWSGLGVESFALAALVVVGGGVATTAGGVKLLRVYALYVHSRRELQRLVHPSQVMSKGKLGREVPTRGVYIAWVVFMLYTVTNATVWLGLTALGLEFEQAFLLSTSALSTTGPLAPAVTDGAINYLGLTPAVKAALMGAMVLGRLETLAVIALLNTDFWRG